MAFVCGISKELREVNPEYIGTLFREPLGALRSGFFSRFASGSRRILAFDEVYHAAHKGRGGGVFVGPTGGSGCVGASEGARRGLGGL